jgi:hypothetical protein
MPTYVCAVAECSGHPIDRCFDCGAHFCARHLVLIAMPTHGGALREHLCAACLQTHLDEPDRYGRVAVVEHSEEVIPSAEPGASAALEA